MSNFQPTESFQGSDNSSQFNPSENFMRDFMKEFIKELPQVLNELKQNAPDVSQLLPNLSFTNNDFGGAGGGGDTGGGAAGGGSRGGARGGHGIEGPSVRPPEDSPWSDMESFPLREDSPWSDMESFPLNRQHYDDNYDDAPSERKPYNSKEAGARTLKENFDDIDVNGDNRLSKNEVKKYIRDEVQSPYERNAIRSVLDNWKHVKKGAIDGPGGVSKEDLQVTINRQVQRGVLNRYPAS